MSMAVRFFLVTFKPHWPRPMPLLSSGELLRDTLVTVLLLSEYCFVSYDSFFTSCVFPGTLIHSFISLTNNSNVRYYTKCRLILAYLQIVLGVSCQGLDN